MLHIKKTVHVHLCHIFAFLMESAAGRHTQPLPNCPAFVNTGHGICWFTVYATGATVSPGVLLLSL